VPARRFVLFGAGAVGGVIGGRLHQAGHDVALIARGEHLRALREAGLRLRSPDGEATLRLPAVAGPAELEPRPGDVVVLAVKSQDTPAALGALETVIAPETPIVCAQNGVENERSALRVFANVYGVHVMMPAAHLEPGVVEASSAPVPGMLDVGRYPDGADALAEELAAAFSSAGFDSRVQPDIMRWKHRKLIMNLGNAGEALFQPGADRDAIDARAEQEGEACLEAAGVPVASREEDRARRAGVLRVRPVGGRERGGGSTWQSLAREAGTIEADYLNGEIALLGRQHGFPTPVNAALQRLANRAAAERRRTGSVSVEEFDRALAAASEPPARSRAD
jgi:2-dehydropantoate 2-reductase